MAPSSSQSSESLESARAPHQMGGETPYALQSGEEELYTVQRADWHSLFRFTTKFHAIAIAIALTATIASAFLKPAAAIFFGKIFGILTLYGAGKLTVDETLHKVTIWCIALIVLGGAAWIIEGIFLFSWLAFGETQALSARTKMFDGMLDKEMEWYDVRDDGIGALLIRIQTQIRELQLAVSQPLGFLVFEIVGSIAALGLAFFYSWQLTLVIIAAFPVAAIALYLVSLPLTPAIEAQNIELSQASKLSNTAITYINTVKTYNAQDHEVWQYGTTIQKVAASYLVQARCNSLQFAILKFVIIALFVTGFWFGLHLVNNGMDPGHVLTTFYACLAAMQSIEIVLPQWLVLAKGMSAGQTLKEIMDDMQEGPKQKKMSGEMKPERCEGDIDVKKVSFAYPANPDQTVLNEATFFFSKGEMAFIVGKSGSGKSTIANLLLKYYEPLSGEISIDGHPIQTLDTEWLRRNITLVQQQSILFNETILQNIAFGTHLESTRQDALDASLTADLEQTLEDLPEGLDTFVGPNGKSLSGGQTQRITIARARLRDAPIVILDEATSALDQKSRERVMKAIRQWRKGKTTIIVTHDVTQIFDDEYVYVMEHGSVVQEGYRKKLADNKFGTFASFVASTDVETPMIEQVSVMPPITRGPESPFNPFDEEKDEEEWYDNNRWDYISKFFNRQSNTPASQQFKAFSFGSQKRKADKGVVDRLDGDIPPPAPTTTRRPQHPLPSASFRDRNKRNTVFIEPIEESPESRKQSQATARRESVVDKGSSVAAQPSNPIKRQSTIRRPSMAFASPATAASATFQAMTPGITRNSAFEPPSHILAGYRPRSQSIAPSSSTRRSSIPFLAPNPESLATFSAISPSARRQSTFEDPEHIPIGFIQRSASIAAPSQTRRTSKPFLSPTPSNLTTFSTLSPDTRRQSTFDAPEHIPRGYIQRSQSIAALSNLTPSSMALVAPPTAAIATLEALSPNQRRPSTFEAASHVPNDYKQQTSSLASPPPPPPIPARRPSVFLPSAQTLATFEALQPRRNSAFEPAPLSPIREPNKEKPPLQSLQTNLPNEKNSTPQSNKNPVSQDLEAFPSPQKKKISTFQEIFKTIWPTLRWRERASLIFGFFAAFIVAASTPAFAYVFSNLLSVYYLPTNRSATALKWAVPLLGIAIIDGTAAFCTHFFLELSGQAWVNALRIEALKRILAQPRAWFDKEKHSPGKLNEYLDRNAEEMRNLIGRFAGPVFTAAWMLSITVVWCFLISWKLTLVALACGPVVYAQSRTFGWVSGKWEAKCNYAAEYASSIFTETFSNIRVVRALTLESYFKNKHLTSIFETYKLGLKRAGYSGLLFGLSDTLQFWVTGTIFYYGTVVVSEGGISVGSVIKVVNLLLFGIANAMALIALIPQIGSSKTTATEMLYLTNLPLATSHEITGTTRLASPFPIVFNNLNFTYPNHNSKQTLSNISLTLNPGTVTAIVGPSGSGKSTLSSLILALYPPDPTPSLHSPPPLTFGGISVSNLNIPSLRNHISIIPQTPHLFPTTILENMIYGLPPLSPYSTPQKIIEAAKSAGIHDFIMSLPQAYQTPIGDGGQGLSGGQAQRIVIARALLRKPMVLVMDEATSALDAVSAEAVRDVVKELREKGVCVVVVSHGREMMRIADEVVVFEKGRVVERGSFDGLKNRGGPFSRLIGRRGVWRIVEEEEEEEAREERNRGVGSGIGLDEGGNGKGGWRVRNK